MPWWGVALVAAAVAAAAVALVGASWRVPGPDHVLVLTGRRRRVVRHGGVWAFPGLVRVHRVPVAAGDVALTVRCVTRRAVPLEMEVDAVWHVGPDDAAVLRAAARFGQASGAATVVARAVTAGLRDQMGGQEPDDVTGDRVALAARLRAAVAAELGPLGLVLDHLHLGDVGDPTGYLEHRRTAEAAAASARSRIARAAADLAAVQAEAGAATAKAAARREADLARTAADADVDRAAAMARQAGPLAAAEVQRAGLGVQPDQGSDHRR